MQKLQNSTARVAKGRSPLLRHESSSGAERGSAEPTAGPGAPVRAAGRDDFTRARSVQAFSRARSPAVAAKRLLRAPQIDPPLPPPAPKDGDYLGEHRFEPQEVFVLMRLFSDVEQLDVEDQGGIRRNRTTGSASSIAELRRNSQLPFTSNFHSCYSFIPAFDHPAASQWK
jgi:hypothetical protein